MALTRERVLEIVPTLPPGVQTLAELDRLGRGVSEIRIHESAAWIRRNPGWSEAVIEASRRQTAGSIGPARDDPLEEAVARLQPVELLWVTGRLAVQPWLDRPLFRYGLPAHALTEPLLRSAFYAGRLAAAVGLDESTAYLAGLLRMTGTFVLDQLAAETSLAAGGPPGDDTDVTAWKTRTLGVSAGEVGSWVLAAGRFPPDLVAAVQHQDMTAAENRRDRLACLVALAREMSAADGFPFSDEVIDESSLRSIWVSAGFTDSDFEKARASAQQAYLRWQEAVRKLSEGNPGALQRQESGRSSDFTAPGEISCNFSPGSGVLRANDALPVHTSEPGVARAAPDFTTFMRNYQNMVFSTAARLTGNDAQAEDISQEVFLKAYENYDHLSTSPTAGGWLKTVATNLSLNHLSRYRNRWRFFSEFTRDSAEGDGSEQPEVDFAAPETFFSGVDADERRAFVERALAELPPNQRVPLVLYHFEDMPYDEIAKKLGVSLAKVKTDILRARAALAKVLARSGTAHEKFSL
jgi:RNA polymerase sigma-70 factor (ECF subfamily)